MQAFDAADVAEVEEPEACEDLAREGIAGDDAAEDVNVDFEICGCIDHGELWAGVSSGARLQEMWCSLPTGIKKTQEMKKAKSAPYQRSCTG